MIKSLSAGLKLQYGLFLLVSKAESSFQELFFEGNCVNICTRYLCMQW